MITAAGLSKDVRLRTRRFGRSGPPIHVVDQVSLEIAPGQVLGIVGPPGSGRTTLGLMLTGRLTPDSGTVRVSGSDLYRRDKRERDEARAQLQIVGEGIEQLPGRRTQVGDVLTAAVAAGEVRGGGAADREPTELLGLVGLDASVAQSRVGALTPRERRLVEVARVLGMRPALVVLDDPLGSGSDEAMIRHLMLQLHDECGTALVVVGSSLDDVEGLCDPIIVMYLGSVMEVIEPGDLPLVALHPYTHALVSASRPDAYSTKLVLKGDPPEPGQRPSGCVFRTRCFRAQERCVHEAPQLKRPLGATHAVACHFPEVPIPGPGTEGAARPDVGRSAGLGSPEPTAREFAEE